MASSSYVIQQLIPALASALARLRRTPSRNEGWVEEALRALEHSDAARYARMRRRIGFARRLGDLAGLDVEETATLTLGLFFHELVDRQPARSRGATGSAWLEYLLRNEDWLAPAFGLCEMIASDEWETLDGRAAIVAKVTAVFDTETLERHERPLHVLEQLGEVESPIAEVIPLLWSEEGQELCDHHFRRHPRGYKLEAPELRRCLAVLHELAPTPVAEAAAVTPFGLSGSMLRKPAEQPVAKAQTPAPAPRPRAPVARPSTPAPAGSNFDRRRQALRARSPLGRELSAIISPPEQDPEREDVEEKVIVEELIVEEPVAETTLTETLVAKMYTPEEPQLPGRHEDEPERDDVALAKRGEDLMEQIRTISPVPPPGRRDALDMMQKLRDVRLQLGQIQRIALDAEQLLTGLAPQLDELAAWIADLDAVVDRWRVQPDVERAA
jgi:hypothetical protein